MKLSEYQNEEALDVLADIIEPTTEILADPEVKNLYKTAPKIKLVQHIVKNHKENILVILARLDNVPREEYKCNILTLPMKLIEILNDKDLVDFFSSQASQE